MRYSSMIMAVALASTASSVIAQTTYDNSALNGTYESVASESYWTNGEFPKGFNLTFKFKFGPNSLDINSSNSTLKDQPPYVRAIHATLDDQTSSLANNDPHRNEIRVRQLAPREFQVLEQKDGDVVSGQYWRFSEDGKTFVRWGVAKPGGTKSKAFRETFRRAD